jgi:5-carboxymethyl-2-hydroxymuconate isomerase
MPHLSIQYSDNINSGEIAALCSSLHSVMSGTGIFPLGGIRVRAMVCSIFAVADLHPDNAFVDMVLRIGVGRTEAEKSAVGEAIMEKARDVFFVRHAQPHFALSLEIVEIHPQLSWKSNSIHPRLKGKT